MSLEPRATRGQSSIEFTLAMIVVIVLFMGTVTVWQWLNRSLIWRQRAYDETRDWQRRGGVPGQLDYYEPEPMFP